MSQDVVSSRTVSIGELLRSGSFEPAKVQRDYCWGDKQQRALLEELIALFAQFGFDPDSENAIGELSAGETSVDPTLELAPRSPDLEKTAPYCFLGAVILYPEASHFGIYDGLQRLTTFTVLFAVLRDLLKAKKGDDIHSLLVTDDGQFRLKMPMRNETLVNDVLTSGRTARPYKQQEDITEAGECLRDCVDVARGLLASWNVERLHAFAAFVSGSVLITMTTIRDIRIATKAFVDTNIAGVRLKPEEMLKGQLIDMAAAVPNTEKAADRILWVWRHIHDDLGKEGFDEFLRAVDFIERREYQSGDFPILLMDHIRQNYTGAEGYAWATERLMLYRSAFRWLFEASNEEVAVGVHASLRRLQLLKYHQWRALAMLVWIRSHPRDLTKRMDIVDRSCFALSLTAADGRRFADVIGRKIDIFARGDFGRQGGFVFKMQQHTKIRKALTSPMLDSGKRATIVRYVEAALHGDRVPLYLLSSTSSVEHVYPRNPGDHWKEFEAGREFSELVMLREMLGNLCVLPRDELGNAGWEEKKKEYQRLKVCKFATEIAKQKTWTPDMIHARTQKLYEATMKFLDLGVDAD